MHEVHHESLFVLPDAADQFRARPEARALVGGEAVTYTLVKSEPSLEDEESESNTAKAVEITIRWGSTILHVAHLSPVREFSVGEAAERTDFIMPAAVLNVQRLPLITMVEGRAAIAVPANASVRVRTGDGEFRSDVAQKADSAGGQRLWLDEWPAVDIRLGEFTFSVALVASGRRIGRVLLDEDDRSAGLYLGLSGLCVASLMGALAYFTPPLGLTDESLSRERLYTIQQYLSASAERNRALSENRSQPSSGLTAGHQGATQAAKGAEGKFGKPRASESHRRASLKGDDERRVLSRAQAIEEARNFGTIGLLNQLSGSNDAPLNPWGPAQSSGTDADNAWGQLWGEEIGEAAGNGLGLSGIGEGSGGDGSFVGINGVASCGDLCGGFGASAHFGGRGYQAKGPRPPREGETTTSGRLPKEVIQRVVRQNFGRFRLCYENGLKKNPNLTGRVSVRFVVGRDGSVANAANAGSDLPDSGVVSCVVSAYYGLSFPAPENGIVTVSYPIVFFPS